MELSFVLGLVTVTLVVIGLVIYFGRKFSGVVQKHAPESDMASGITLTGTALTACMVGFWVICAAARVLNPEGSIGTLLSRADGVVAVFMASVLFFGIGAAVLKKLGYPIMKRGGQDN